MTNKIKTLKNDTIIKVDNLTNAAMFMRLYKERGAYEVRDKETSTKGGRKYNLNGEIVYIYMV